MFQYSKQISTYQKKKTLNKYQSTPFILLSTLNTNINSLSCISNIRTLSLTSKLKHFFMTCNLSNVGPFGPIVGSIPRIHNSTCQNRVSGNPGELLIVVNEKHNKIIITNKRLTQTLRKKTSDTQDLISYSRLNKITKIFLVYKIVEIKVLPLNTKLATTVK